MKIKKPPFIVKAHNEEYTYMHEAEVALKNSFHPSHIPQPVFASHFLKEILSFSVGMRDAIVEIEEFSKTFQLRFSSLLLLMEYCTAKYKRNSCNT